MWKRLLVFSPFIGGLLGAVVTVLILVLVVNVAPFPINRAAVRLPCCRHHIRRHLRVPAHSDVE